MECKMEKNKKNCSCSYKSCEKRGICCDCVTYHQSKNEIPGCFFPPDAEKSWDRSVKNFVNCFK